MLQCFSSVEPLFSYMYMYYPEGETSLLVVLRIEVGQEVC